MEPGAANQAGHLTVLGGMADQPGRFTDHKQIGVFMEDVEHGEIFNHETRNGTEIFRFENRLAVGSVTAGNVPFLSLFCMVRYFVVYQSVISG